MRQNALFYSAAGPSRWLRRTAALIDHELAALCRMHWQSRPRVSMLETPAYLRVSIAAPSAGDLGRFRR
jgi:hypothetical protein